MSAFRLANGNIGDEGFEHHGSLTRYAKLRVAHAPGRPGTFPPPPWVSDPDIHHGTSVTHVPWCMTVSVTSGFLWSQWQGKRYRHSRNICNPQFSVSGKRPMQKEFKMERSLEKIHSCNYRNVMATERTPYVAIEFMQNYLGQNK